MYVFLCAPLDAKSHNFLRAVAFVIDDLLCMAEEWLARRCPRIVERAEKEHKEDEGADDTAATGEGEEGVLIPVEVEEEADKEAEDLHGLTERGLLAVLSHLQVARTCEDTATSTLVAASVENAALKRFGGRGRCGIHW